MTRAFDSRMLSKLVVYKLLPGYYDDDNIWIPGQISPSKAYGVVKAGNKFSQLTEGISLHNLDGGSRYSDYRTLYAIKRFKIEIEDKIKYKDLYYNILQKSDEAVYGFNSFIIERVENWEP